MKKRIVRLISSAAASAMLLQSLRALPAIAADGCCFSVGLEASASGLETTGGTCGKNAVWELDSSGTLTVSGTGTMYGLNSHYEIPWAENKASIIKIVIGTGITNVGSQCFSECKNLTSVTLSDTVTSIDESAFSGCSTLTSIVIPDSVTNISTFAFASCKKLIDIKIPASVTRIGSLAFSGTAWLSAEAKKEPYVIVNNLLIFGPTEGEEAVIPSGVTDIVSNAFYGRTGLKKLTIPDTVTNIEYNAFSDCSGLVSVTVPASVEELGMQAFVKCTALKEVTVLNPACKIYDRANTFANDSKTYSGVIKGYNASTAEAYAKKYGYTFQSLGDAPEMLRGDLNRSGTITADDAQLALMAYLRQLSAGDSGLSAEEFTIADVDKNGILNADDAQHILIYATQMLANKNPRWSNIIQ